MEKLQANFNFGGFYNSNHDWVIDNYIDTFIRDRETDELPENEGEIYDAIDYKGLRNLYCGELIKFMNSKMDISLEYVELNSPAYYNFTTDKIVVKFDENDFENIKEYTSYYLPYDIEEDIEEVLKEWTTIRDGYIPFYDYSEIKDNLEWRMEAVLQIFEIECLKVDSDFWLEWYDLIDDLLWQVGEDYGIGSVEPIYEDRFNITYENGIMVKEYKMDNMTENDKFNWCLENLENLLLHKRFEEPIEFLEELRNWNLIVDFDEKTLKENEEYLLADCDPIDYHICAGINEDWGYVDIYYLYDLRGGIIITELIISEE